MISLQWSILLFLVCIQIPGYRPVFRNQLIRCVLGIYRLVLWAQMGLLHRRLFCPPPLLFWLFLQLMLKACVCSAIQIFLWPLLHCNRLPVVHIMPVLIFIGLFVMCQLGRVLMFRPCQVVILVLVPLLLGCSQTLSLLLRLVCIWPMIVPFLFPFLILLVCSLATLLFCRFGIHLHSPALRGLMANLLLV